MRSAIVFALLVISAASRAAAAPPVAVPSPDGRIQVVITVQGAASYTVNYRGREILRKSQLGVVRDDADFTQGIDVTANYAARIAKLETVEDHYSLLTSKRRDNVYRANRRVIETQTRAGKRMDIEVQVSDDGFAFRYVFPEADAAVRKISREVSSFNFQPGTRGFLQPIAPARSGWNESNPSYEEYYERDIPVGQP